MVGALLGSGVIVKDVKATDFNADGLVLKDYSGSYSFSGNTLTLNDGFSCQYIAYSGSLTVESYGRNYIENTGYSNYAAMEIGGSITINTHDGSNLYSYYKGSNNTSYNRGIYAKSGGVAITGSGNVYAYAYDSSADSAGIQATATISKTGTGTVYAYGYAYGINCVDFTCDQGNFKHIQTILIIVVQELVFT